MNNALLWDTGLIRKYDLAGPRYTSYPTAVEFSEEFDRHQYETSAWKSSAARKPLSLYIHIPFCSHVCYYCGCNKIVTKHKSQAESYLDYLFREIEMQAERFNDNQPVEQLQPWRGNPYLPEPGPDCVADGKTGRALPVNQRLRQRLLHRAGPPGSGLGDDGKAQGSQLQPHQHRCPGP